MNTGRRGRPTVWTDSKKAELEQLIQKGLTIAEIARRLGVARETVSRQNTVPLATRSKIRAERDNEWKDYKRRTLAEKRQSVVDTALAFRKAKMPWAKIADQLGVSRGTLRNYLVALGLADPIPHRSQIYLPVDPQEAARQIVVKRGAEFANQLSEAIRKELQ